MPKKQDNRRVRTVAVSQDVAVPLWVRSLGVLGVAGVVIVYLIAANASATRSLTVSNLEDEIEELLVERSELTIQEAHIRHKSHSDREAFDAWQNVEISGYVALPVQVHEGSILALSE